MLDATKLYNAVASGYTVTIENICFQNVPEAIASEVISIMKKHNIPMVQLNGTPAAATTTPATTPAATVTPVTNKKEVSAANETPAADIERFIPKSPEKTAWKVTPIASMFGMRSINPLTGKNSLSKSTEAFLKNYCVVTPECGVKFSHDWRCFIADSMEKAQAFMDKFAEVSVEDRQTGYKIYEATKKRRG